MDRQGRSAIGTAVDRPLRRVLIVDDSPQVRQELRTLLSLSEDLEIVGEAPDGREAIRLAEALGPDVVLLDLGMPVMDGLEAARQIKSLCPSCLVVALTVHGDAASRELAAGAGVDVYLEKGVAVDVLFHTISGVPSGPDYFSDP